MPRDSTITREKLIRAAEYLFAATMTLSHLSHLAEDLIFYTTDEAAYAELPDAMATGSSRMPQKKNPDVLELTPGEIAEQLGRSESSVHGLHHRGRRVLQGHLRDLECAPVTRRAA